MPHSRPAKNKDVLCSTCIAPNTNLETVGFSDPLFAYAGRYVDSDNTRNVQNVGMRTVRAQRVRINYPRKRILVRYGETVAGFPIDLFLKNITNPDLWPVSVMKTGSTVYRYGDPIEIVAKPSTFFYAEAKGSGWVVTPQDMQVTLTDFDSDGIGNVFTGSYSWGWGIAWDQNDFEDCRQMEFRCQLPDAPIVPNSVIYLQQNKLPYVVISASTVVSSKAASLLVYDVSNDTKPVLKETRNGKPNAILTWDRFDETQRLAVLTGEQRLCIYDCATFVAGGAPIVQLTPSSGKTFRDFKFDENGTLWAVESTPSPATGNKLWQVAPSGKTYTTTQLDVYGSAFAPQRIAPRKGWIAVGGQSTVGTELRLFRYSGSSVQSADTQNFFFRYYHDKHPAPGFCTASTYNPSYCSLDSLQMLDWNGVLYLLYSANGLGDVFELKG